jgi:hypothetical protein
MAQCGAEETRLILLDRLLDPFDGFRTIQIFMILVRLMGIDRIHAGSRRNDKATAGKAAIHGNRGAQTTSVATHGLHDLYNLSDLYDLYDLKTCTSAGTTFADRRLSSPHSARNTR